MYSSLRTQICDYLSAHPEQFAGFVDGSFDAYVANMRENGTYGGHVELSAFAQLSLKQIKVIQPSLVFVITGVEDDEASEKARTRKEQDRSQALAHAEALGVLPTPQVSTPRGKAARGRRRAQGASQKASGGTKDGQDASVASSTAAAANTSPALLETIGPLYIAYHNWEHYSSVRNLAGPHTGLPRIRISEPTSSSSAPLAINAEDNNPSEPTEEEERVMRCLSRTHSVREIRDLLAQQDFNSVVELLTEQDAQAADDLAADLHANDPPAPDSETNEETLSSPQPRSGSVSTPATVDDETEEGSAPQSNGSGNNKRLSTTQLLDERDHKRRSHSPLTSAPSSTPSPPHDQNGNGGKPPRRSARLKAAAESSSAPSSATLPPRVPAKEYKQMRAVEKALNRKAQASAARTMLQGKQRRTSEDLESETGSSPLAVEGFRELKI